nr:MAG TPA: hypothetical protein [Caudoviricetes sp.]
MITNTKLFFVWIPASSRAAAIIRARSNGNVPK